MANEKSTTRSGIYEIVNTVNGKRYIGSAKHFEKRWNTHKSRLNNKSHHNRHLQASWAKHGAEVFEFRKILICAENDLLLYEQIMIDTFDPEFNVERIAGNSLGCIRTPETRAKIAAKAIGRKCPPRSDSHREKLSLAQKGKQKSLEHMQSLQAGRAARVVTDEQRIAISLSLKNSYKNGSRKREKTQDHRHKIAETVSKLTADQVREIRRLRASGITGCALASRYQISASSISEIIHGVTYLWVT